MTRMTRSTKFSQYKERFCRCHSTKTFSENVVAEKDFKFLKVIIFFAREKGLTFSSITVLNFPVKKRTIKLLGVSIFLRMRVKA